MYLPVSVTAIFVMIQMIILLFVVCRTMRNNYLSNGSELWIFLFLYGVVYHLPKASEVNIQIDIASADDKMVSNFTKGKLENI